MTPSDRGTMAEGPQPRYQEQDVQVREVNFDGIVGPSHNYAGLSFGNLASTTHRHQASSPRAAALQGLEKMRLVHQMGIPQAVLPPLKRPKLDVLRSLGFEGKNREVIETAWTTSPELLAACYSASNMWTANAATVSPSPDCADGRLHLSPANLASSLHRNLEAEETTRVLRAIFSCDQHFHVHDPLPANLTMSDEGAANHTRLCGEYSEQGLEVFVFGHSVLDRSYPKPKKFPARQSLEASQAIARRHQLLDSRTMMIQQQPTAIDAGVFHNDVICVGNQNVLIYHDQAFVNAEQAVAELAEQFRHCFGSTLFLIRIATAELSLEDAVRSYLFNSQLLSCGEGEMVLVCPAECQEIPSAHQCISRILGDDNPINRAEFLDLRQSMNNGGGPACLRLRVVMSQAEWDAIHPSVRFDDRLHAELTNWVKEFYREQLHPEDLRDPQLIDEIEQAFIGLAEILNLPGTLFGL